MYSWRNFIDKAKRYFPLEKSEKKGLILTLVVLAFIFSFRSWGIEKFDAALGFKNFFLTLLFVAIALAVRELTQRTIAVWLGYRAQYKAWLLGLVIGLVVTFVSNGRLIFLAPGILLLTHLETHRLGKAFYAFTMKHYGWIAMSAPVANMLLAVIMKSLYLLTGVLAFKTMMTINIWIALFDIVPIPPYNGSHTFFGSRYVYVFVFGAVIGCAALLTFLSGILPIIGALFIGALLLWAFFVHVDKRW